MQALVVREQNKLIKYELVFEARSLNEYGEFKVQASYNFFSRLLRLASWLKWFKLELKCVANVCKGSVNSFVQSANLHKHLQGEV